MNTSMPSYIRDWMGNPSLDQRPHSYKGTPRLSITVVSHKGQRSNSGKRVRIVTQCVNVLTCHVKGTHKIRNRISRCATYTIYFPKAFKFLLVPISDLD
jgi:hypothetical protein